VTTDLADGGRVTRPIGPPPPSAPGIGCGQVLCLPMPARASGKKKVVSARFVHNDRLIDALMTQAFSSLRASPGARAYYDRQRERGAEYNAALRQLANRLVGILHGCLQTGTPYDETTAWSHHAEALAA
jgi:hypothetical protein